jgi:hypothetical protein
MSTPTAATYVQPPSRPLGVAILAVLIGLYGFLVFLIGLFVAVGATLFPYLGAANPFHGLGVGGVVGGLIVLIIGLIILGLAVGLWHLRMWALVLTVLFLILVVILDALAGAYITLGFILAVILLIYLLAVSSHFR